MWPASQFDLYIRGFITLATLANLFIDIVSNSKQIRRMNFIRLDIQLNASCHSLLDVWRHCNKVALCCLSCHVLHECLQNEAKKENSSKQSHQN